MTADAAVQRGRASGAPSMAVARPRLRTSVAGHVAAVVLVAASSGIGWMFVDGSPVAASSNASLKARAAAIVATINADDGALTSLGEHYLSEAGSYEHAMSTAKTLTRSIASTSAAVRRFHGEVVDAAVNAYVSSGTDSNLSFFLGGSVATLATGETYLRAASDRLGEAISDLDYNERVLADSLANERRVAAEARVALATTTADRGRVLATVARERTLLSSVRGQLATLVHDEELAAERARAAAQAAAARAAAQRAEQAAAARAAAAKAASGSTTTTAPSTTSASPTASPSGPPAPSGVPPASTSPIPSGTLSEDFAGIRGCESSDDYTLDTGNGYYGAYQFSLATWQGLDEPGVPSASAPDIQDGAAYRLYESSGWGAWPECAAVLGLT